MNNLLTIELDNAMWESLVEYSRSLGHDKPAQTVEEVLRRHLVVFVRGQQVGVEKMAEGVQIYLERTDGGAKIYVKHKS